MIISEGNGMSFKAVVRMVEDRDERTAMWPQQERDLYSARAVLFAKNYRPGSLPEAAPVARVTTADIKPIMKRRQAAERKVLFYVVAAKRMFGSASFTPMRLAAILRLPVKTVYRAIISLVEAKHLAIIELDECGTDSAYEHLYTVTIPTEMLRAPREDDREAVYSVEDLMNAFTMTYYDVLLELFGVIGTMEMLSKPERMELAEIAYNTERKDYNRVATRFS